MNARVESYAGSTNPEHPRAIDWEGTHYTVIDILHRRREPHGIDFLVRCMPGDVIFDLFYLFEEERWQILPKGSAPQ